MSEELAAEAFLRVTDYENHQYYILFCIIYAKSYHKNGRLVNCLELLMQKYNEHPTYTMFLYHYGRICAKSADLNYTNSAIDALQESIRLCNKSRYGKIYYWLSKVLYQKQNYYKAFKAIKKALKYLTGHINSPKINEIKILYEDLKPKYEITQDLKTRLNINEISPEEANHSRNLIGQIKTFDKELSEIFEAKIL